MWISNRSAGGGVAVVGEMLMLVFVFVILYLIPSFFLKVGHFCASVG